MPCYHPRLMIADGFTSNGKTKYKFVHGQALHADNDYIDSLPPEWKDKAIMVPCKKCIGCRLEYSRRWADRMMLELDHSKTAVFLTLTYDNEHLSYGDEIFLPDPYSGEAIPTKYPTTVKRDVQLFNKRLREYFAPKEIRFYLAAEYGPSTLRPHYHGIYFGLSLADFPDIEVQSFNVHKQAIYKSEKLAKLWKNGFVTIANVSWQSCAYVARYSLKKLGSEKGFAESRGVLPEWSLCSHRPGIGGFFHIDHPDIFDNPTDKIFISDKFGVKSVDSINLPAFNFEKLQFVDPDLYAEIKEQRKRSMNDRFFFEYLKQDKDEVTYLEDKEIFHENSVKVLARNTVV